MTRDFLIAVFVFAITLGGLFAYNSDPILLTESQRLAARQEMKEEYKATIRDLLERFRTGRLTEEERADIAATQERLARAIEQSMKEAATEVEKAFQQTADSEVDLKGGGNAIDACLHSLESHDAFLVCLDHVYR